MGGTALVALLVMKFGHNLWRQLHYLFIADLGIGDWDLKSSGFRSALCKLWPKIARS